MSSTSLATTSLRSFISTWRASTIYSYFCYYIDYICRKCLLIDFNNGSRAEILQYEQRMQAGTINLQNIKKKKKEERKSEKKENKKQKEQERTVAGEKKESVDFFKGRA